MTIDRHAVRAHWIALALLGLACTMPAKAAEPQLAETAQGLMQRLKKERVSSVAVVDFTDLRGRTTELGRFLAEELSAALANVDSGVRVIDRLRLATILEEQKLSATGLIDPKTIHELGQVIGVEALITGRLTPLGDRVQVTLLAVRTGTAQILLSENAEVPRTQTIEELERRALTVTCPPGSGAPEIALEGPVLQRTEAHELELALHGCRRASDAVQCGVAVRNLGDERHVYLTGKSRIVYGEGNQVMASRVTLGGKWATGSLSRVGSPLLEGVTATIGVVFEGVPERVETLRMLELDFYGFEVRFRDVPLDR